MSDFFNEYFNIKKMVKEKREYKERMARMEALPDDYQYVFKKMQKHMWKFAAGSGYDMIDIQNNLIELFESGAASGKPVLDVTGEDVAAFCDELLRNAETYTENWREELNRDIMRKLKKV